MPEQNPRALPDPFLGESGVRVGLPAQWPERRREISRVLVNLAYGGMPPAAPAQVEVLHTASPKAFAGSRMLSCRVTTGSAEKFAFQLQILVPAGAGPFPVVLTGDACWAYATGQVVAEVLRRGYVLAQFNRVELASDAGHARRDSGIYPLYPGLIFGALSAWAWGYQRCIDVLQRLDFVNAAQISVVGHSRGGKAALLAGATDERIALTSVNNSGAGGAGCYRWQGPQSENLADLLRVFPYWFGPKLAAFVGRELDLPFDQHFLKALVAPRALLTTEALGDLWANPEGAWQTHLAAKEVYRFLHAESQLGIAFRLGSHEHNFADWCTFLDFADVVFHRSAAAVSLGATPFDDLARAFEWHCPAESPSA